MSLCQLISNDPLPPAPLQLLIPGTGQRCLRATRGCSLEQRLSILRVTRLWLHPITSRKLAAANSERFHRRDCWRGSRQRSPLSGYV